MLADFERYDAELHAALGAYWLQKLLREERRLTLDLFRHIEDDGLALEPLDPTRPAAGFRIVDPRLALQVVATEAVARRAAQARNAFAREHAALLQEYRDQQQMTRIRDALAGDDPTVVRDALADIPRPRARPRRSALPASRRPADALVAADVAQRVRVGRQVRARCAGASCARPPRQRATAPRSRRTGPHHRGRSTRPTRSTSRRNTVNS